MSRILLSTNRVVAQRAGGVDASVGVEYSGTHMSSPFSTHVVTTITDIDRLVPT